MKIQFSIESVLMFASFVISITISALMGFQVLSGIKIPIALYFFCGLLISLVLLAFSLLKGIFQSQTDDPGLTI